MNHVCIYFRILGGLAPLGAFLGCLGASVSVKVFGPKGSILFLGCPMFLLSWMATALAPTVVVVYIARFIGVLHSINIS